MTDNIELTLSDEELLERARRGEADAYGRLYDRYIDPVYRYIYFRVTDRQDAEDLTEDVFFKTWQAITARGSRVENVRAWLYRTAHNQVIDYYRTHKNHAGLDNIEPLVDGGSLPEAAVVEHQAEAALLEAVQQLDGDMQQVIACRFINGMSHAETAEIMGLKVNHLRVLQHRALKRLHELLSRPPGDLLVAGDPRDQPNPAGGEGG